MSDVSLAFRSCGMLEHIAADAVTKTTWTQLYTGLLCQTVKTHRHAIDKGLYKPW